MPTKTATDARREFFELVKGAASGHKVYRISHRKGSVVLLSEEDYDSLLETLELLSIPGFRRSIRKSVQQMEKGETFSFEDVFGSEE
jgi:antitoxin YefM